ncbi:exodeoxyribonuclease V subunit alpha [Crenothrix sp.]|uniref:exodeoxyribonuclease V subunit alpha n=1 Tax=Crenothrix sp. TaxID=3100433 RepID=UPI00374CA6A6
MSFSRLDNAFARFLSQRSDLIGSQQFAFEELLKLVSCHQTQGHNCIRINDELKALALASGLAGLADQSNTLPLIVEQDRLYLHRYWNYENRLVQKIQGMTHTSQPPLQLEAALNRYFTPSEEADWQREAAKIAVTQSFSIITGGPGTGKTTTVVKILALLQELADRPLYIALAAPTGKAAMRLQESIGANKTALPCTDAIRQLIPETVTTLHRLLGAKPPSPYFRHDADNPLAHDLVVVDEASMVDLALMSKLLDALKVGARLILLGDQDQLASVESGAVLTDLTAALPLHTLELKKSHRFGGIIKEFAVAVNQQQPEIAWQCLHTENAIVSLLSSDLISYIAEQQIPYLSLVKRGANFTDIYHAFNRFQVLCSNHQGKKGVSDINYRVEQKLFAQKHIYLAGQWYAGRPVMVTQNNAALHLYNGDIGLCLPDKEQHNKLMVFFQDANGQIKKHLPSRLPQCETVFAMTIHKSQGSEFENVLLVLPDTINPVLTKELLYTGITRAKETIKLATSNVIFAATVTQKIERVTGLIDKFKEAIWRDKTQM